MAPLIFISHSAKDPEAAEALPELALRLREAGLDAWYDRERLALPGFQWRHEIEENLHLCRAAVVLMSPSALQSDWVLYEASVLAHRSRMAAGFLLLPMLVDGVCVEQLRGPRWGAIELDAVQIVHGDPVRSQQKVLERLQPLRKRYQADAPEARLENALVHHLNKAGKDAQRSAAARLKIEPREWEIDLATAVARRLLEVPIEAQFDALRMIADTEPDVAIDLYEKVAPHGWITPDVAEQVRRAAGRPSGERGFGLNAERSVTCAMHVRSGFFGWQICEVEGSVSDDDVAEFVRRARASLLQWMRHDFDHAPPDDDEIDHEISVADDLPFLVLPIDAAFPAVVAAIRQAWPHVPILLRCPGESSELFASRGLPHAAMLEPPIEPAEEIRIMRLYANCRSSLRRRARD